MDKTSQNFGSGFISRSPDKKIRKKIRTFKKYWIDRRFDTGQDKILAKHFIEKLCIMEKKFKMFKATANECFSKHFRLKIPMQALY